MPKPGVRDQAAPPAEARDAEMRKAADEEIRKQREEAQQKLRERQLEKQRRLEEADRLEREANKPMQPTQENINRQMKLLQEAQRLREMP
jgi:CRISPR/Cas system-associated protein Cas10 (large subunit of type III CRISPR-Cas system)